jgi:hypothetical protein
MLTNKSLDNIQVLKLVNSIIPFVSFISILKNYSLSPLLRLLIAVNIAIASLKCLVILNPRLFNTNG